MKKWMSLMSTAAIMLSLLAGCAGGNSSTSGSAAAGSSSVSQAAAGGNASMRVMWWGSQARHDGTIAAIKLYETKNQNVKFQYEFMGGTDYWTKLNTLVAANDVPDVFQVGNNFSTYQSSIEPLDGYVEKGLLDISDTSEAFLAPTTLNDNLMGVSLGSNTWCVVYDPALFAQAGVAEPSENWTWEEFEQDCYKINEKLGIYGTGALANFWSHSLYIAQHSQKDEIGIYTKDSTALGYEDDKMLSDFFEMKKRLMDKKGVYPAPDVIASIKDVQGDLIVTQKSAMAWVPSNQVVALNSAAKRELKIALYPRIKADGPSGMTIRNSQAFCISNTSKYKDEAAKFISFFVNDLEANDLLGGERGVPIMRKVRVSLSAKADDVTKEMYQFIDLTGTVASHPQPLEPVGQIELEDTMKRIDEELAFGKITPEEAAANFRKDAAGILKK